MTEHSIVGDLEISIIRPFRSPTLGIEETRMGHGFGVWDDDESWNVECGKQGVAFPVMRVCCDLIA
jgi:hypothetical protein